MKSGKSLIGFIHDNILSYSINFGASEWQGTLSDSGPDKHSFPSLRAQAWYRPERPSALVVTISSHSPDKQEIRENAGQITRRLIGK